MTDENEKADSQEGSVDRRIESSANNREFMDSGLDTHKNQDIHKITQSAHNIEMSATNLIVPKDDGERLGLVDEEKGIIHTGAGMLPIIPDESSLSYAEKLKAIKPTKTESELAKKKADATLEWMRYKGFDSIKEFEFCPSPLSFEENAAEHANDNLPAIAEEQIELYSAKSQSNGKILIESGISRNIISNPWQSFKNLSPEQQHAVIEAFQKAQNIAQDSIHTTADDILKQTLEGYINTVKLPIDIIFGISKCFSQIVEFEHDLLFDPLRAQEKAALAGENIGKALVIGVKLWSGLINYGSEVQTNKDYSAPFKDLGKALNSWFESLTPGDQMNALAGISAGFGINALGKQIRHLAKPGAFVQFLEEVAESAPKTPETEHKIAATIAKLVDFITNEKRLATAEGIKPPANKLEDYILKMVGRNGIHLPEKRPLFLVPSENRILKTHEVDAMGGLQKLEKMSEAELANLGITRYRVPRITLETTPYNLKATIPEYPDAFIFLEASEDIVTLLQIKKGKLPDGIGNIFLSETLKGHGVIPTHKFVLKNVIEKSSQQAFAEGATPERTKVAKLAIKALKELDVEVESVYFDWNAERQSLNIVINVRR